MSAPAEAPREPQTCSKQDKRKTSRKCGAWEGRQTTQNKNKKHQQTTDPDWCLPCLLCVAVALSIGAVRTRENRKHNVGTAKPKILSPTEYPRAYGAPPYAGALVLTIARTPNRRLCLVTRNTEASGAHVRDDIDNQTQTPTRSLPCFLLSTSRGCRGDPSQAPKQFKLAMEYSSVAVPPTLAKMPTQRSGSYPFLRMILHGFRRCTYGCGSSGSSAVCRSLRFCCNEGVCHLKRGDVKRGDNFSCRTFRFGSTLSDPLTGAGLEP